MDKKLSKEKEKRLYYRMAAIGSVIMITAQSFGLNWHMSNIPQDETPTPKISAEEKIEVEHELN